MNSSKPRFFDGGMALVFGLAVTKFALHCLFNNRYGYFRDEFDYMACGNHPAWGYVDHPPLVPMLVKLSRILFGDSLRSIRFFAALASSGAVILTGMIARELGGGRFAVFLSALAVVIAPIYLSDGSLMTTNALEPLLWMGCVYFAILAIKRNEPRYWLWFGVIAGIGLEEKYSILLLGLGIVVGLLLTGGRRVLLNRWLWMGGAAALLIFLPNLLWNIQNHWPFLELTRNIKADGRDVELSPFAFLAQQALLIHPLTAPIWIAGLIALLFGARWKSYRMLGWCYLVVCTVFIVLKGKNYYLAPIYPMLLAAGAIVAERALEQRKPYWKGALVAVFLAGGILLAPITIPVLSVDQFLTYVDHLPFAIPRTEKSHAAAALPQHYADQVGWEEVTAVTAQAWNRVSPEERPECGIFGQNYGQAGALDFFGPRYGLPPALSGHQTYHLWGPRGYSGNCLIVLGDRPERLSQLFETVEYVGRSDNAYALEGHIPVYICKRAKFGSLADIWPKLKKWR